MKAHQRPQLKCLPGVLLLEGCGSVHEHSPTIDVLGSYFPAWMLCIVVGLFVTLITRQMLIGLKLHDQLRPALLVYLCMWILFTLALWLIFFQN